jgi:hypothetical protein
LVDYEHHHGLLAHLPPALNGAFSS